MELEREKIQAESISIGNIKKLLSVHPSREVCTPACHSAGSADTVYSANLPTGIYSCP